MPLPPRECHVWCVDYDEVPGGMIGEYRRLLDSSETERCDRFRFERDRDSYCISHALLRTTLSQYVDVDPQAWRFVADRYGKPAIVEPAHAVGLRFNLSHTRGMALVGIAVDVAVGVDVETLERANDADALAERYFSSAEVADLRTLPDEERRAAFFEYWTLKESYIKGRGLGLSLPLDQFSFAWSGAAVSIAFDPRMQDRPEAWRFAKWRPAAGFQAAAAVNMLQSNAMQPGDVRFSVRQTVPLIRIDEPVIIPTS